MARIRTIKPSFFTDADLGELSFACRLVFVGLWCHADREGRLKDNPRELKVQILPYDTENLDDLLTTLCQPKHSNPQISFIVRYEVDGEKFIHINSFSEHQYPHIKEVPSTIPAPNKNSANIVSGLFQPANKGKGTIKGTIKGKNRFLHHILLTPEEYKKLIEKFGQGKADEWIKTLDEGIALKGYKYRSHYMAILKWERMEKEGGKKKYI